MSVPINNLTSTLSTSTEKLARYPSMESVNSASGIPMRKMMAVEIPDIKPSDDFIKPTSNGLRRGESMRGEHPAKSGEASASSGSIKRSESMKLDEQQKKLKKTPSFTTRRRTQSFRKNKHGHHESISSLPPVEIEGFLERKQELQSGGKRAAMRSWKTLYTVLCGQLVCFFRDKEDFIVNKAAASPLTIHQAKCSPASDYTKKKNVFRLQLTDGAEYLFVADEKDAMTEWINKVNFHASLPPRMQLMSYDDAARKDGESANAASQVDAPHPEGTSRTPFPNKSSQDYGQFPDHGPSVADVERGEPQQPIYVNFPFRPEVAAAPNKEVAIKPPVPARSSSIPSHSPVHNVVKQNNSNDDDNVVAAPFAAPEDGLVRNRIQMFQNSLKNRATYHGGDNNHDFQTFKGGSNSSSSRPRSTGHFDAAASDEPVWVYRKSVVEGMGLSPDEVGLQKNNAETTGANNHRNSQSAYDSSSNVVARHHSLPPYSVPPDADYIQRHSATVDARLRSTAANDGFGDSNDFSSDKKAKEKKRFRFFKKT